ncbi:hypothetical protein N0V90_012708 [Kalmusia sp. IMI 367209]|nr:hypothetical protein N0V90_012708 [Kalmusia sp. IMI 367209]
MENLYPSFEKLQIKGRTFKDMSNMNDLNPAILVSHVATQDVENSRVVAVCGIPRWKGSPEDDGWFFSDFFAFKHILSGLGVSQTWIATVSAKQLVQEYGEYLHGNPYRDRKVVLNKEMVSQGFASDIMVVPEEGLYDRYLKQLELEASEAKERHQSLLILIFAHGSEFGEGGGFWLGEEGSKLVERSKFRSIIHEGLPTTVISTACFSGEWAVDQKMEASAFTAAGPDEESSSWNGSPSIGRYCGSIYASSLLAAWRKEVNSAQNIKQDISSPTDKKDTEATFYSFTGAVWDSLYSLDKFASVHDIRFSAQNDDWSSGWSKRLGFPALAVNFEQKWDSLITVKANPSFAGSSLNREVSPPVEDQGSFATGRLDVKFGSIQSARNHVGAIGKIYLRNFPGPDNVASNTTLHGRLRRVLNNKEQLDFDFLETVYRPLLFRLGLSNLATTLLLQAGIPLPHNRACSELDMPEFIGWAKKHSEKKFSFVLGKMRTASILPEPSPWFRQGSAWIKPRRYIATAITLSSKINNDAQVDKAIESLEEAYSRGLRQKKKALEHDPDVRGKQASWYHSMRKRLRTPSPDKREKRQSLRSVKLGDAPSLPSLG